MMRRSLWTTAAGQRHLFQWRPLPWTASRRWKQTSTILIDGRGIPRRVYRYSPPPITTNPLFDSPYQDPDDDDDTSPPSFKIDKEAKKRFLKESLRRREDEYRNQQREQRERREQEDDWDDLGRQVLRHQFISKQSKSSSSRRQEEETDDGEGGEGKAKPRRIFRANLEEMEPPTPRSKINKMAPAEKRGRRAAPAKNNNINNNKGKPPLSQRDLESPRRIKLKRRVSMNDVVDDGGKDGVNKKEGDEKEIGAVKGPNRRQRRRHPDFQLRPGETTADRNHRMMLVLQEKIQQAVRLEKQERPAYNDHPATEEAVDEEVPREDDDDELLPSSSRRFPPDHLDLYISCHPGLQKVVYEELDQLGYKYVAKGNGAILTVDTIQDLYRCHAWLGAASHIFLRCGGTFRVRAMGELERKIAKFFPWQTLIHCGANGDDIPYVRVKCTAKKSRLIHSNAIAAVVHRAVHSVIGPPTPPLGGGHPTRTVYLTVTVYQDVAQISLDTTAGHHLHQRGYRLNPVKAPLREDMAYAIVWQSHLDQYEAMFDPFCGSGTLAIEAAGLAAGLPPGRLLPTPLAHTTLLDENVWNQVKQERRPGFSIDISASDRDHRAFAATKDNAARAGVTFPIEKEVFTAHPLWNQLDKNLLMVTNPPFGVRLQGPKVAEKRKYNLSLYQSLATRMNQWATDGRTFGAVILTNDRHAWRPAGFANEFETMCSFVHGGIAVTAQQYLPFSDGKVLSASGGDDSTVAWKEGCDDEDVTPAYDESGPSLPQYENSLNDHVASDLEGDEGIGPPPQYEVSSSDNPSTSSLTDDDNGPSPRQTTDNSSSNDPFPSDILETSAMQKAFFAK
jgi:putative N6-adenine-specific DNA methylase